MREFNASYWDIYSKLNEGKWLVCVEGYATGPTVFATNGTVNWASPAVFMSFHVVFKGNSITNTHFSLFIYLFIISDNGALIPSRLPLNTKSINPKIQFSSQASEHRLDCVFSVQCCFLLGCVHTATHCVALDFGVLKIQVILKQLLLCVFAAQSLWNNEDCAAA